MSYFPPPYNPLFAHLLFPSSSSSSLCHTFLLFTPLSLITSSSLPLPPLLYVLLSSSLHPSLCSSSSSSSSLCPTFLLLTSLLCSPPLPFLSLSSFPPLSCSFVLPALSFLSSILHNLLTYIIGKV